MASLRLTVLRKWDSMFFVKFLNFYRVSFFFTEFSWATASDFQQHFGHITCSISNKSTYSQLTVCLGSPQRSVCKQFTVFVSKIFKIRSKKTCFAAKVDVTIVEYLAEAVTQWCFSKNEF